MGFCILIITISLPKQAKFRYEFEKGTVWLHKDLVSPYSYAIKKTSAEIEKDQADILKSVLPVYRNNTVTAEEQVAAFASDLDIKWKSSGEDVELKPVYLSTGQRILGTLYARGISTPNRKYQRRGTYYNFLLLTNNVERHLNTVEIFTPEAAGKYISGQLQLLPAIKNKAWLADVMNDHIEPNYLYDEHVSERLEADAISNISVARGMVQKGELIVSSGTIITPEIFKKLESLREAYEEDARIAGNRQVLVVGQFLLVSLCITMLIVFLFLFRKDIYADNRLMSLILIVVTGMLVTLSLAMRMKIPSVYYIPYCVVPIIIRILFDTRLALNIHTLVILIAGFYVPNSFEFTYLQITSGMVALYSIKSLVKREQFLISAFLILCNYFVGFVGISFIRNGSLADIEWINFTPFVFSVLLSLLAYPLIYAFERLFGIISDLTLIELTNTNSRILRDLSYKAPGTFQHSLQVANLAEAAIFKIGGNALLVRAGAMYHDIGKMENPQFFIENQNKGTNPHDNLSYEQSAQLIIQHVHKGIELARRSHIPEIVIDFIRTHHGNTRVDYFYQSFLKNFPEKLVDENIFRYPGPIPFSKETAVLMLADSVEAASRSIKEPSVQSISDLVDRIIDYKLEQDQLNDSNITLKDIETIKLIFKTMLMGIYHVRIDYAAVK
ncbi:HDIG domain-containing protein [Pedobacter sp. HMF7056]|uniref:HDIG domain-containing protein n=1 Tax=Hufsiella ginkgonis TaxID=2695274 RepID=A0A7K1XXJ2_9SPHI|nr:HDIG domain-containing metalloprotein [Hufsiella ginkgonis]MXV15662.1 HDIG domain-containing protein [Hufsiella ginkgonis]